MGLSCQQVVQSFFAAGTGAISQDPLPAGSVYTAAIDGEANVGLYRLEVTALPGSGKLRTPATMERQLKESLRRAFSFLQSNQDKMGLTPTIVQKDFTVEAVELPRGRFGTAQLAVAPCVALASHLNGPRWIR